MIKRIITLLLMSLIITLHSFGQINFSDSNLIQWGVTNKLKWENFQAKAESFSLYAAESTTFIKSFFYQKNDSVFCRIITFFNPKKSWKKEKILNPNYGLNHEQIHFDITEIFALKIRQQILTSHLNQLNEHTIQRIYYENVVACNNFHNLYDSETNHSINKINQDKWNMKIENLLLSLNEYKEQRIYIKYPICKICWK